MRRINVQEFLDKQQKALDKLERARLEYEQAKKQYQYEWDLIQINYYGYRWLIDKKVGGWDNYEGDPKVLDRESETE